MQPNTSLPPVGGKSTNVVISATQQSAPRRFCSCRKKKRGFALNASDNLWPGSCSCCLWPLKSFQIHFLLEVTSLLGEESHYIRGEVSGRLPLVWIETKYNGSKPRRYSGKSNSAISWPCYQFWSSFPYFLKDTSKSSSLWVTGLGSCEIRVFYFTMCVVDLVFSFQIAKNILRKSSIDHWKQHISYISAFGLQPPARKNTLMDLPCQGTKTRWELCSLAWCMSVLLMTSQRDIFIIKRPSKNNPQLYCSVCIFSEPYL